MTDQERDDKLKEIERLCGVIAEGQFLFFGSTIAAITFAVIILILIIKPH